MLTRCPARADLERLVQGIAGPEVEALEAHLSDCDRCLAELSHVRASDPVLDALRHGSPTLSPDTVSPDLAGRLHALGTVVAEMLSEPVRVVCGMLAAPQAADEIGRLGSYRVLRLLGVGGMGVVFQAEDTRLKREVALKVMQPAVAADPASRRRFQREAEAMATVKNDHVATIHQIGEEQGVPFLVMELLHGETLDSRLRRAGRLPLGEILRIGRQVTAGLAAVHEQGLVHRDIKPGNIWLEVQAAVALAPSSLERVKVLDFGLAREAKPEKALTRTGGVMGTPMYMAPEQAEGKPVDARCDLFSLGCVLYAMATGASPFDGDSELSALHALANREPPPVHEVNPEVPRALSDLIAKLLRKDPARRPASAAEVGEVLALIADSQPAAKPRGWGRVVLGSLLALAAVGLACWAVVANRPVTSGTGATPAAEPRAAQPPPAPARFIRVEFEGTVQNVDPTLAEAFAVGSRVTGSVILDYAVKPRVSATPRMHAYFDCLKAFRMTVGGVTLQAEGGSEVQVDNDLPGGGPDRFDFGPTHVINAVTPAEVAGRKVLGAGVCLTDPTRRAITDASVLPPAEALDGFPNRVFYLHLQGPNKDLLVEGPVTALAVKPVGENP